MYRISVSYAVTIENWFKIQSFTAFLWKKPFYMYRKIKHFWISWNLRMILNCISFTGEKDFLNVSESNKFRIKNNINVMVEGLACIGPISRFNPESLIYKEKWLIFVLLLFHFQSKSKLSCSSFQHIRHLVRKIFKVVCFGTFW